MGKITFVSYDGVAQQAEIVAGQSLMQIATSNAIAGIDGDCGGECACGTCHVFVDSEWQRLTGEQGDEEEQMLEMTPERQPNSRLSCQIRVSEDMDGMTVHLPEFQM